MTFKKFRVDEVDRKTILEMLLSEQAMRYSDSIQDLYDQRLQKNRKDDDPELVEKLVQKTILRQFGFDASQESIQHYQSIGSHYAYDQEIMDAVHYLRINIIRDCPIKVNQCCVDAKIMTLDGQVVQLSDYYTQEKPLVILSGSIT
jgi:hypothetical protein